MNTSTGGLPKHLFEKIHKQFCFSFRLKRTENRQQTWKPQSVDILSKERSKRLVVSKSSEKRKIDCFAVSETREPHRKKEGSPCCIGTLGNNHSSTREAETKTSTKSHSEKLPLLPVQPFFRFLSICCAHNASHRFVDRSRIAVKSIQILPRRFFLHLLV